MPWSWAGRPAPGSWRAPRPERPSEAVRAAHGASGAELALARALGAEWLDDYVAEWRHVRLEIGGSDLLAAGVPEGPAIGRGLRRRAARRSSTSEVGGARPSSPSPSRPPAPGSGLMEWRETDDGLRWLEAELPGARAAFSTRLGGVSDGRVPTRLNLGLLTGDERDGVRENRQRLAEAVGLEPENVLIGRQVHGAEVAVHDGPQEADAFAEPGPRLGEVDGHATAVAGLAPLVFVADCLPIALSGPGGVAMVHGGWRGLAGGILARGAEAVEAQRGCDRARDRALLLRGGGGGPGGVRATLGPGIARGRMLDLPEVARRLLARSGVEEVESSGLCASCERELFFSHRRDAGRTGRQAGLVWRCPS